MKYLLVHEFLNQSDNDPLVDVRSPSEYKAGHIPGSVNIPLLDDEERTVIGTLYKEKGRQAAIDKGLEIVGPKMSSLAVQAREVAINGNALVYCWRGGMRSEKMAWLFELAGLSSKVLQGGYKAYRSQVLDDFLQIDHLIVLEGLTGSGKTDILQCMREMGEQVVDLEYLANHRGSAFGSIGLGEQPTTLQFQNEVHRAFRLLDFSKRIWVEGESINIGKVNLPETLWSKMKSAQVVEICVQKSARVKRLVVEYGDKDRSKLVAAIERIGKKLGGFRQKEVLQALEQNNLYRVADLLLEYYDKSYRKSHNRYLQPPSATVNTDTGDPVINARKILDAVGK